MFLNGASGFSYYSDTDFTDMEYYLSISEAMRLLVPFEDLLIDGDIADISSSSNCVVSAFGLSGDFLIGVTPIDVIQQLQFEFHANGTGTHVLVDVSTDKAVQSVPSGMLTFKAVLAKTAVYRFAPAAGGTVQ
jgi:hypothetical protein